MKRHRLLILGVLSAVVLLAAAVAASSMDHSRFGTYGDSYAAVDQEANSNIMQSADVFAPGPGDVFVGQDANSNIQQDADVTTQDRDKSDKQPHKSYDDRYTDRKQPDRVGDRKKRFDRDRDRFDRKDRVDRDRDRFDRKRDKIKHDQKKAKKHPQRGKNKYTVCHEPPGNEANRRTLTVGSKNAVKAHLGHSDYPGPC